jgi:hypothetical protein
MKILRSLLAIVIGWIVSVTIISAMEFLGFVMNLPPDASVMETMTKLTEDPEAMKAWIDSMPPEAHWLVLGGWQIGAFIGGLTSALIAGRARVVHAGVVGMAILAGTVLNAINLRNEYGFVHPDGMLIASLLLPIPVSLIAGKLVATVFPPAPVNPS